MVEAKRRLGKEERKTEVYGWGRNEIVLGQFPRVHLSDQFGFARCLHKLGFRNFASYVSHLDLFFFSAINLFYGHLNRRP